MGHDIEQQHSLIEAFSYMKKITITVAGDNTQQLFVIASFL
jgi:hypothetical protein